MWLYEQVEIKYRLKLYAIFINGKMKLLFIDKSVVICYYRGTISGRFDYLK
jgi:hypothetical protein